MNKFTDEELDKYIGRKVIINGFHYPKYSKQVGTVINTSNGAAPVFDVKMPDDKVLNPYCPMIPESQCEFIDEKSTINAEIY